MQGLAQEGPCSSLERAPEPWAGLASVCVSGWLRVGGPHLVLVFSQQTPPDSSQRVSVNARRLRCIVTPL